MSGQLRNAGILGTGSAVPDRVLTNNDMEKIVETSDEWIRTRTGIRERRIADPETATSDLGTEAAKRAISDAGVEPGEIDCIIVATVTPDMFFPSTACIIQSNLDIQRAAAFDLSAGCSGFTYALSVARHFVAAGAYEKVLVIGAEVLSKFVNWSERSTCVLFGDGAGAVVVGVTEENGILSNYLGADGKGGASLCLPGGGSRLGTSKETIEGGKHFIHMSGNEVFKFAVRIMVEASFKALELAGIDKGDIDLFIPHQANIRIINAAAERLELAPEKVFVNVDKYGNTSAASIPIALDEANRSGLLRKGDHAVIVGFGAGLTWGSAVLKWTK